MDVVANGIGEEDFDTAGVAGVKFGDVVHAAVDA